MSYHVVPLDEIDARPIRPDVETGPDPLADARSISRVAGLERLGLRTYTAAPGEQIPVMYHYHERQEEAFYVLDGELHVETPEGEYTARRGEIFVAETGHPHRAFNPADADGSVRVPAIGAPTDDPGHRYDPG